MFECLQRDMWYVYLKLLTVLNYVMLNHMNGTSPHANYMFYFMVMQGNTMSTGILDRVVTDYNDIHKDSCGISSIIGDFGINTGLINAVAFLLLNFVRHLVDQENYICYLNGSGFCIWSRNCGWICWNLS